MKMLRASSLPSEIVPLPLMVMAAATAPDFSGDRTDGGSIGSGVELRPQAERVGEIYRHAGRTEERHHQQCRHDAEIARAVRYETGRKDRHAMSPKL